MRRPVLLASAAALAAGALVGAAVVANGASGDPPARAGVDVRRVDPSPSATSAPSATPTTAPPATAPPATPARLPGGGRVMFPGRRLVAIYGYPGSPSLGVLGEQSVDASVARVQRLARPYRALSAVPVVPTFEIIATVARGAPGPGHDYSAEATVAFLRPWVRAAARHHMYVVLDLQPGRADVLAQARRYRSLLLEPHVGLAVDPEWKLGPRQKPLGQIGSIGAAELNRTSAWLAQLTRENRLPQKVFVVHQFSLSMIRGERRLRTDHPEVRLLIHMDGQGSPGAKEGTWGAVTRARPPRTAMGWKNFFDEDTRLFSPAQTLHRRPSPVMVSYQ